MKYHGKLLAFLAAWLTTIGAAFFLPNEKLFGADCTECLFCEMYHFAGIYTNGVLSIANGYFDPDTGVSESQAFEGGVCNETGTNLYQARDCSGQESCGTTTGGTLRVYSYAVPNWTCTLPNGANPGVQEFNGGNKGRSTGTVTQNVCYVSNGSGPVE